MKPILKAQGFSDSPFARCESRFEKADIRLLVEPSIQLRFGRTPEKALSIAPGTFRAQRNAHFAARNSSEAQKTFLRAKHKELTMLRGRKRYRRARTEYRDDSFGPLSVATSSHLRKNASLIYFLLRSRLNSRF